MNFVIQRIAGDLIDKLLLKFLVPRSGKMQQKTLNIVEGLLLGSKFIMVVFVQNTY